MDYIFVKSTKQGKEEFGSVYARIRTKGYNKKYAIGFTIREREWIKYLSLKYSSSNLMASIGLKYGQFANILVQIKTALEDNFDPDTAPAIIRSIRSTVMNGEGLFVKESKKKKKTMLLLTYMEQYIEEMKTGVRFKRGTSVKVSDGHIKKLNSIYKRIKRYERDRRKTLSLNDATMEFQRDFVKWYRDNGLSANTIRGDLMNLGTVLKSAFESKLTVIDDFRHSQFVPKGELVDHVFLSLDQIEEMLNADFGSVESVKGLLGKSKVKDKEKKNIEALITDSYVKQLDRTRDIFIVGCLSGQRFSDYSRICNDMIMQIEKNDFINIVQEKTKKKVIIPMDTRIRSILDKYNGKLPKVYLSDFNLNLKRIALILGWTFKAKIDEERMGSKISTRFCDLISSHTARRTFATNAYAAGIPLVSIMSITGHTTEQNLRLYLKLQAEDKAIIAAKDFENIIITK